MSTLYTYMYIHMMYFPLYLGLKVEVGCMLHTRKLGIVHTTRNGTTPVYELSLGHQYSNTNCTYLHVVH